MTRIFLLFLGLSLTGCKQQPKNESDYPHPVTAFGFITYSDFGHTQMYFVPLKDKSKKIVSPKDFKANSLGIGFAFDPSARIKDEISLLEAFKIKDEIYGSKPTKKYEGKISYIPVRIVYEIDPNALNVFTDRTLTDTIYYGQGNYNRDSEEIGFIVNFPGADVLKISNSYAPLKHPNRPE